MVYNFATILEFSLKLIFRKFLIFLLMFLIEAALIFWTVTRMTVTAKVVFENAKEFTPLLKEFNEIVFSGKDFLPFLILFIVFMFFSLYALLLAKDNYQKTKGSFWSRVNRLKENGWKYLFSMFLLIGAESVVFIICSIFWFVFFFLPIIHTLAFIAALTGALYFNAVFIYTPYTAFLTGSVSGSFQKTNEYMKGHIGGSFFLAAAFTIICRIVLPVLTALSLVYNDDKSLLLLLSYLFISAIFAAVIFFYNITVISYILYAYFNEDNEHLDYFSVLGKK